MVVVSYSGKEINAKLVYYGPGLSGKTTNLEFIYDSVPSTHRGKMVSMKTRTERTLFFDFLPVDLGEMGGFKTRFLLYTVPGQVYYNATRKLVLRGVDALVFVADSERGKMNENIESLENLRENLREYGLDLDSIPWVIQFNKRDLPETYSPEELNQALNPKQVPWFEAVATNGTGVFETFKGISRLLLEKLSKEIKPAPARPGSEGAAASSSAPAPAAAAAPTPVRPAVVNPVPISSVPRGPLPAGDSGMIPRPVMSTGAAHASAPPPASAPSTSTAHVTPISATPAATSVARAPVEEKRSMGSWLARLFGFPSRVPAATSGAHHVDPPVSAPPAPKPAALIQVHKVDIQGSQLVPESTVIEKQIRVPVPIHLTPEESRDGVTLKLIVELDVVASDQGYKSGAA